MTAVPFSAWPSLFHPFGLPALPPVVLVLIVVWSLFWKGLALWKAAQAGHAVWFIILLVVNTVGVLEIAYVVFMARRAAPPPAAGSVPSSESVPTSARRL